MALEFGPSSYLPRHPLAPRWNATVLALAGVILLLGLAAALPSSAAAQRCPGEKSADADGLMGELERRFRSDARIVRMDIRTEYARSRSSLGTELPRENRKTLWGVFNGDVVQTRLLYVFSGPSRLAGTSLLMHDYGKCFNHLH